MSPNEQSCDSYLKLKNKNLISKMFLILEWISLGDVIRTRFSSLTDFLKDRFMLILQSGVTLCWDKVF